MFRPNTEVTLLLEHSELRHEKFMCLAGPEVYEGKDRRVVIREVTTYV